MLLVLYAFKFVCVCGGGVSFNFVRCLEDFLQKRLLINKLIY